MFVNDLIRASICDIVRPDEVERCVREIGLSDVHDIHKVYEKAGTYIPHRYNDRCLLTGYFDAGKLIMYLQALIIEIINIILYQMIIISNAFAYFNARV